MKKFKYKVIRRVLNELMTDYDMNSFGSCGWELSAFSIGVRHAVYLFKQEISE